MNWLEVRMAWFGVTSWMWNLLILVPFLVAGVVTVCEVGKEYEVRRGKHYADWHAVGRTAAAGAEDARALAGQAWGAASRLALRAMRRAREIGGTVAVGASLHAAEGMRSDPGPVCIACRGLNTNSQKHGDRMMV